jgi:hypothetical protein
MIDGENERMARRTNQLAMFMTVKVGDLVGKDLVDDDPPWRVEEKDADDKWIVLVRAGNKKRLSYEAYNELGYVFYK